MLANGVYAMSAVTAITAQNTRVVSEVMKAPASVLEKQLECICSDIFPDAVKIGMMPDGALALVTMEAIKRYGLRCVVYDPVMVSSSGTALMEEETRSVICEQLLPLVSLVTPNIAELEILSGMKVKDKEQMRLAAKEVKDRYQCAVLCKGGHLRGEAQDLLYEDEEHFCWFSQERIDNQNTHGTGCTLSSAIAANLAKGFVLPEAVACAKRYITGCIRAGLDLGAGSGPMNHGFDLHSQFI